MVWNVKAITRPDSLSFLQDYLVGADCSVMPDCEWLSEISAVPA
ncbi:Uncharacterised protein [Salmonella enterica]|nr:Uncharacterised protein [Salmonella enterica]